MTLCARKNASDGREYCFMGSGHCFHLFAALLLAFLLHAPTLPAQVLAPSVVSSAGSTATAGGLSLDWTLGETAVSLFGNDTMRITEGFHQPVVVTPLATEGLPGAYAIDFFPNPSSALVTVRFAAAAEAHYTLDLLDVRGFTLIHREVDGLSASVDLDLRALVPATYFLRVLTDRAANASIYKVIRIR